MRRIQTKKDNHQSNCPSLSYKNILFIVPLNSTSRFEKNREVNVLQIDFRDAERNIFLLWVDFSCAPLGFSKVYRRSVPGRFWYSVFSEVLIGKGSWRIVAPSPDRLINKEAQGF